MNTDRIKRLGLLPRIIVSMALGIGAGYIFPEWCARIFITFNALFSQFLGFIIPLLILGLVAPAIIEIGNRAGKMLLFTVALAYAATVLAGLASYATGAAFFPSLISPGSDMAASGGTEPPAPFFTIEMAPLMTVTSALILAFTLGLCVAKFSSHGAMRNVLSEDRKSVV